MLLLNLKRKQFAQETVRAKSFIEDLVCERLSRKDAAYFLATDPSLRNRVEELATQFLHPTRLTADEADTGNKYINPGAGFSTFWAAFKEPQEDLALKVHDIEDLVVLTTVGMDPNVSPGNRKMLLKDAGLMPTQIKDLLGKAAYDAPRMLPGNRPMWVENGLAAKKEQTEEACMALTEEDLNISAPGRVR